MFESMENVYDFKHLIMYYIRFIFIIKCNK